MRRDSGKTGLLNIFVQDNGISLEDIYGKAVAILGVRGSGKTNTAAVIVEELLSEGLPVVILDIDGEYWSLRENYDILIVSSDEKADIRLEIDNTQQATKLARALLDLYVPAVIDVSEFIVSEYSNYLTAFIEELWRRSKTHRRPFFVVVEEAHEFIPQGYYSNALKNVLVRMTLRGRKRGIGLILVSQRSAKVDKDVLTQAEYYILHKVLHPADLRVYKELLPLSSSEIENIVPKLGVGEALFYNGSYVKKVKVRKRRTFHVGYTPKNSSEATFKLKSIDRSLLERLINLINQNATSGSKGISLVGDSESREVVTNGSRSYENSGKVSESFDLKKDLIPRQDVRTIVTEMSDALKRIVPIIYSLSRSSPSTVAHVYILALKRKWLSYSELRKLSGFTVVNTRELKRLERLGFLKIEKHGKEMFVRQNFLDARNSVNEMILESLGILFETKVLPTLKKKKRKTMYNDLWINDNMKSEIHSNLRNIIENATNAVSAEE